MVIVHPRISRLTFALSTISVGPFPHSVRMASTGSRRLARMAG